MRLPPGLRDKIKTAAEKNKRSMNAEMVARLDFDHEGFGKFIQGHEDLELRYRDADRTRTELLELVHSQDTEIQLLRDRLKGPEKEIERLKARLSEAEIALQRLNEVAKDYRKMHDQAATMIDGYAKMVDDSHETSRILKAHVLQQYSFVVKLCDMVLELDTEPTEQLIELVKRTRQTMLSSIESFSGDDKEYPGTSE